MGLGHGTVLVLGGGLVELVVLSLLDLIRLPDPDKLGLVTKLPIPSGFVDLLGLRLLLFLIIPFLLLRFLLCNFFLIFLNRPTYSLGA